MTNGVSVVKYVLLEELLFSVLFECMWRSAVRDAIEYKRNKRQKKQFYAENTALRNFLRSYAHIQSNAPRHMLLFQIIRILNLIWLLGIALTSFFANSPEVCDFLLNLKVWCLYVPFCLYGAYYFLIIGDPRKKRFDFDRFKKP